MSDHDLQLIERCVGGDARAWTELVGRFAGLVFAVARRHGLREDQCEDVAQSVFSSLARRIDRLRDPGALPKWLITSATRESWRVDRVARRAARSMVEDTTIAPSDESLQRLELAHRVRVALDDLGGRCRDLLLALFVETSEPNYQQISERLGIAVGSIGPTRARCIAKLVELLGESAPHGTLPGEKTKA